MRLLLYSQVTSIKRELLPSSRDAPWAIGWQGGEKVLVDINRTIPSKRIFSLCGPHGDLRRAFIRSVDSGRRGANNVDVGVAVW